MDLFSKGIKNLDNIFMGMPQDSYYVDIRITKVLLTMIDKATTLEPKSGSEQHLAQPHD